MSSLFLKIAAGACALCLLCFSLIYSQEQSATARVVRAADAFLATLNQKQHAAVVFPFNDSEQRQRWSNFPTTFVKRGGISLKDMTAAQNKAAMALLATVLSLRGYEKVQQIMEGDEVNKTTDQGPPGRGGPHPHGNGGPPPGNGGPPPFANGGPPPGGGPPPFALGAANFGKDLYYISFLGTPSQTKPWMMQFGGHHLALNITIAGEHGVLTPTLTGAQPALYTENGKTVRPLADESDKALALLNALDTNQRKKAILSYELADLVLGPGQDGKTIQPEGLKVSEMNNQQRAMLLDVMTAWAGIINDQAAAERMRELTADLDQTWFAWSGPTTAAPGKNITAYYRIQGPHVVIEYSPQTLGGDPALHVHTMYRDPTNDYGQRYVGE